MCYFTVTTVAIRSLTAFSLSIPPYQVNKYAKELLAAMSSGMEERDDPGKLKEK